MTDITPMGVLLPSHRKVARELSDDDLEALLLAGEAESTPAYLLALLKEWDRRNNPEEAA